MLGINLNSFVKVKLTDYGKQCYIEDPKKYYESPELRETDDKGYTKFQLWDLMSIFGPYMMNGGKIVFEKVRILVNEKDVFNPEEIDNE